MKDYPTHCLGEGGRLFISILYIHVDIRLSQVVGFGPMISRCGFVNMYIFVCVGGCADVSETSTFIPRFFPRLFVVSATAG